MLKIDMLPQGLKPIVRGWVRTDGDITRTISKTAMRAIVKPHKSSMTIPAAVDASLAAYWEIKSLPRRNKRGIVGRMTHRPRGITTYAGTPQQRLDKLRANDVLRAYRHVVDRHAHGVQSVKFDNSNTGVNQTTYVWGKSGSYNVYATDTTITVPSAWRTRVMDKQLAVCDGMMTLDAHQIESTGCELFSAVWVRKNVGKQVTTESGYIARVGNTTFHGATIGEALKGIVKKTKQKELDAKLAISNLQGLVDQCPDVPVYLSDAVKIGACEPGIRHWCSRVGIDVASGSVTLQRMWQGYNMMPMQEARSTILRVLRRNRNKLVIC